MNGLDLVPRQFVNFCGEGEWFVGTRGGSADHAAMKFGGKGTIIHVKFHDFELLERVRLPDSHRLVVCNSFLQAKKAAGAKRIFNSRVTSYVLGVALARRQFPQFAPFIRFVRDINPQTLHTSLEQIYELVRSLPPSLTVEEARQILRDDPQTSPTLLPHIADAASTDEYPVRGVMLFGLAECARARRALDCLKCQDTERLGELMKISHDGERCFLVADDLSAQPVQGDVSDRYLDGLLADLRSDDPLRIERAQLYRQPGVYSCSTREIDALVDIASRTPGVLGAQIAGAGLGGCAMILVETDAVATLSERIHRLFYEPQQLPSGLIVCMPAAGSCLVSIPA